ncbi:MAG TPA: nitrate/sulfonate/bicarbonate ABC transporter ATP-binding protein [Planctomycetaceae bacterium]|nr:nitrate/sulfonate/bicarbonate ABC transporter ATP-binding protein [Planctomycetaceae bacterium]|tara:strand:- start:169 stop:918 length:750 start_codon:yes stop_codon:yes gene_type:complete
MPFPINVRDVSLSFGSESILQDLNLEIQAGEFITVLGPSGCGKTSLLRIIAGLQLPSTGELQVGGGTQPQRHRASFVFQDPTLLPWRNALDNVRLPLELAGTSRSASISAAEDNLNLVGLQATDRDKYPRMLSGGMRMRVSLARALVGNPDVLLFDEPFAALDDLLRQRLNEDIMRLWMQQQWTALFVTHNVAEAVFLGQRIVIMSDRPATIRAVMDVPFSFPRSPKLRATADFAEFTGQLSAMLRGES